jgi:hypothetical protein
MGINVVASGLVSQTKGGTVLFLLSGMEVFRMDAVIGVDAPNDQRWAKGTFLSVFDSDILSI